MPRIAGAMAVMATIAFCIGFNVYRYPMVWDMVNGPEGVAQAELRKASSSENAASSSESKRGHGPDQAKDDRTNAKKSKEQTPTASMGGRSLGDEGDSDRSTGAGRTGSAKWRDDDDPPGSSNAGSGKPEAKGTTAKSTTAKSNGTKPAATKPASSKQETTKKSETDKENAQIASEKKPAAKARNHDRAETGDRDGNRGSDTDQDDLDENSPRSHRGSAGPSGTSSATSSTGTDSKSGKSNPHSQADRSTGTESSGTASVAKKPAKKSASAETVAQGRLVPVTPSTGGSGLTSQLGAADRGASSGHGSLADRTVRRLPNLTPEAMHNPNLSAITDTVPFYPSTGL